MAKFLAVALTIWLCAAAARAAGAAPAAQPAVAKPADAAQKPAQQPQSQAGRQPQADGAGPGVSPGTVVIKDEEEAPPAAVQPADGASWPGEVGVITESDGGEEDADERAADEQPPSDEPAAERYAASGDVPADYGQLKGVAQAGGDILLFFEDEAGTVRVMRLMLVGGKAAVEYAMTIKRSGK